MLGDDAITYNFPSVLNKSGAGCSQLHERTILKSQAMFISKHKQVQPTPTNAVPDGKQHLGSNNSSSSTTSFLVSAQLCG